MFPSRKERCAAFNTYREQIHLLFFAVRFVLITSLSLLAFTESDTWLV